MRSVRYGWGTGARTALWTAVGLLLVAAARAIVQVRHGEVGGLDTGNWLTFGHDWLGRGLQGGSGSTYPPVVPVAAAGLCALFGPLAAIVVLGAVATFVYAGAAAGVLWRAGAGSWTAPLAVVLGAGSAAGEMVAWGGFPQLFGLGIALVVLYVLAELVVRPSARVGWALGVATLLLGAVSHLVLAETLAAGGVIAVLRLLSPIRVGGWRRFGWFAGVCARAALPCLLLVPLYVRLVATVGESYAQRQQSQTATQFLVAADGVMRESPLVWEAAALFSLAVPLVLWRDRVRPLWLVTVALGFVLVTVAVLSPEPRHAYLIPLLLVSAMGLVIVSLRALPDGRNGPAPTVSPRRPGSRRVPWRRMFAAGALVLLAVTGVQGLRMFPDQERYYADPVPVGTIRALDVLRASTPASAVVVVPPVRGVPFGWWVEGYGQRASFVGSSSNWLNFPVERARAATSVRLFSRVDVLSPDWLAEVRAAGIDVAYIPRSYDGIGSAQVAAFVRERPDLVVLDSAAALIVRVP